MLGDLDLMQCAQKDAPTMRRLSVELSGSQNGRDIPGAGGRDMPSLRRLSTSSVASSRSSMSQEGSISPTFSSSLPNSFYLERVSSLLGRTASLPVAGQPLPSIPTTMNPVIAGKPLQSVNSSPAEPARVSSLLRSLSKGMDSFR